MVLSKVVAPPSLSSTESSPSHGGTAVLISVVVCSTGLKHLYVRGKKVLLENCVAFSGAITSPEDVTLRNYHEFLPIIDSLNVCPGNPDGTYVKLCLNRKSLFKDKSGSVVASLDNHSPFTFQGDNYFGTIRVHS